MNTAIDPRMVLPCPVIFLRWAARLLALAVLGLYVVIFLGEGGLNPLRLSGRETLQISVFVTACAGLVIAWRWEALGGALTLAALLMFYLIEHALTGHWPRGWGFAIMTVPAVLYLLAAWLRVSRARLAMFPDRSEGPRDDA